MMILVTKMFYFVEYNEQETYYQLIIKYPFLINELLGSLYVLNVKNLNILIQLLNSQNTLPFIIV
ncbi:unnamed protein product [Paramecium pentaurelia]|uniref:Uncharacterized protein n=1 Tax=Paramecium pentaurelia TaxID=43138 RepID=A0A8S1S0I4_9CILI|nr:unnamed protein product [Paramecium pentaurelia]